MGMGWDGRKSLKGVILRAPLCGANNTVHTYAFNFVITVHTSLDLGITQRALSPASSLTMGALSAVMKFIVIL